MDSGDFAEYLPGPDPCLLDASLVYFTHLRATVASNDVFFPGQIPVAKTTGICATKINKACRCPFISHQPIHFLVTLAHTLSPLYRLPFTSPSTFLLCVHNCAWVLKTMNRRTFEGPMDWEYQNQPPVDFSSPFAKLSQAQQGGMSSIPRTCLPFSAASPAPALIAT